MLSEDIRQDYMRAYESIFKTLYPSYYEDIENLTNRQSESMGIFNIEDIDDISIINTNIVNSKNWNAI